MAYTYYEEHDEDVLPVFSIPVPNLTKRLSNNYNDRQDTTIDDRSSGFVQNWKSLYEKSVFSLTADDESRRSITQTTFYPSPKPYVEEPQNRRIYSPIYQEALDNNKNKSKWEIRLPQLLDSPVGPDRQKRDLSRRHTANIVFQQHNSNNDEFDAYGSSQTLNRTNYDDRPITPIVKQLKEKFNKIIVENEPTIVSNDRTYFPSNNLLEPRRVTDFISRRQTTDNNERLVTKPRPMLPLRPITHVITMKSRSSSIDSIDSRTGEKKSRVQRNKTSPPISYPKYAYPPPSTTSVVKQLLGGNATLIYDSIEQPRVSNRRTSIKKNKNNIQQIARMLSNTNENLSGRQLRSDSFDNDYATLQPEQKENSKVAKSRVDESNENNYEQLSTKKSISSNNSSENDYFAASSKPHSNSRSTMNDEPDDYDPVFDDDE